MPPHRYRLDPNAFDHSNFLVALNASDQLSAVLRAHVYTEAALAALIEMALPYPTDIELDDPRRFGFDQKLDLAVSLDLLDPSEKGAYRVLNEIRNGLAHHPEAFVSVGSDLQHLSQAVPGSQIIVVRLNAPMSLIEERIRLRQSCVEDELCGARWWAHRMGTSEVADHVIENGRRPLREVASEVLRLAAWLP